MLFAAFQAPSLVFVLFAIGAVTVSAEVPRFEFHDGDRVLIAGGESMEHEDQQGYFETALTSSLPRRNMRFRSAACRGNTVWSDSLGLLQLPAAGHGRLFQHVRNFQPTVVILAYGAEESFCGDSGLEKFSAGYDTLIQQLQAASSEYLGAKPLRLILMTPHQWESPPGAAADVETRNAMLGKYAQVIRAVARRHEARLVELYDRTGPITLNRKGSASPAAVGPEPPRGFELRDNTWKSLPLTEDGFRLSGYGSLRVARMVVQQLKLPPAEFLLQLASAGEAEADTQVAVSGFQTDGTHAKFQVLMSRLPEPPTPLFPHDVEYFVIAGGGLPSGNYQLKIDGIVSARNPTVLVGFPVRSGPDYEQAEQLRKKIVAKNRLVRSGWQPHETCYLKSLRDLDEKAIDAAWKRFTPCIQRAESAIAEWKRPKQRLYEIVPRTD